MYQNSILLIGSSNCPRQFQLRNLAVFCHHWPPLLEKKFFSKKVIFRGKIMREIDCAHSRTVKTLPWPWFREGIGVLKRKSIYLRKESYTVAAPYSDTPREGSLNRIEGGVVKSSFDVLGFTSNPVCYRWCLLFISISWSEQKKIFKKTYVKII